MSEQEHLCCGSLLKVKQMFGSCAQTNSYLSDILDRQRLLVATPIDLRTKKAESVSPQLLQKKKNPKMVVMSPTVTTKGFKQKDVIWQQYHFCLSVAEHQILG